MSKSKKAKNLFGDLVVWCVTLVLLAIFALLTVWFCKVNVKDPNVSLFVEDFRHGETCQAVLKIDCFEQVRSKQVVWTVDGEVVKKLPAKEKEAMILELTDLSVGSHFVQVAIDKKVVAQKTINKNKPLLVVACPNLQIEYGQTPQLCAEASGFVDGDTAKSIGLDLNVELDTTKKLGVGRYKLACKGGVCDKYDLSFVEGELCVSPKRLTFAPRSFDKIYDGTPFVKEEEVELIGVLPDDHVGVQLTLEYTDKNVGVKKRVLVKECALIGEQKENYYVEYADADFCGTISPLVLKLVDVLPANKFYDGTTSVSFLSGGKLKGVVSGDKVYVGFLNACFVDAKKGDDKPVLIKEVTLVGEDSQNYVVLPVTVYATIFGKTTQAVHGYA